MLTFHSFLQAVCQFVKTFMTKVISKKAYRSAAVLMSGAVVITVVTFSSTAFGGGGRNALAANVESSGTETERDEDTPEETEAITEAKIQFGLTGTRRRGQLLVGGQLTRDIQKQQEDKLDAQAEIEEIKLKIQIEAEERARAEAEAARAEAEAARIAAEEEARRNTEEAKKAAAAVSYTEEDYQVFLRIVQAEAGICDDKGKIMVANVIINRVRSKEFPDTITEVVYQQSQFSPVSNGSINSVKVTQQTIDCVNRALAGEDYSDGALYFMYRGGSRSHAVSWFDTRLTFLFQHGNHEFFK